MVVFCTLIFRLAALPFDCIGLHVTLFQDADLISHRLIFTRGVYFGYLQRTILYYIKNKISKTLYRSAILHQKLGNANALPR